MSGLEQPNVSYLIMSSGNIDALTSILWAKEYQILPIKGYYDGQFEDSVMAYKLVENDELRRDAIMLLGEHGQESAIIKYTGDSEPRKIYSDGAERPLGVVMFNTDSRNKSYLHNGVSFSFVEKARYRVPRSKDELRAGMVVEYMSNNKWCQKRVGDLETEWEKMYRLLSKYDKIRIEVK